MRNADSYRELVDALLAEDIKTEEGIGANYIKLEYYDQDKWKILVTTRDDSYDDLIAIIDKCTENYKLAVNRVDGDILSVLIFDINL